jgi:hypothetical protein
MAEATSITCEKVMDTQNGWQLLCLKATTTNGETITIPTTGDGAWVNTSTKVMVVESNNITDGTSAGVVSVAYDDGNRRFTVTDAGASDDDVRILFLARQE